VSPKTRERAHDPSLGGHQANGKTETLLTGDTAAKVEAAAKANVPGGTIERVENDVDTGSPYEAHVTKPDGSEVVVYVDSSFNVTSVGTMGPPRRSSRRQRRQAPGTVGRLRMRRAPPPQDTRRASAPARALLGHSAPVPLGVPSPVGPSYPPSAVHRYDPPQAPLEPPITSNSDPMCA
jgi:hypothetical protein